MIKRLRFEAAVAIVGIILFAVSGFCGTDSAVTKVRLFGFGSYEFGEIMKGQYKDALNGSLDHYWNQQVLCQIGLEVKKSNGLSFLLAGEGSILFPYTLPTDGTSAGYDIYKARTSWYIKQAVGSYSIDNSDNPALRISTGLFTFNYNPDARNFGDYLFRINPYPQYLPTTFDTPYASLLGLDINSTLFTSLRQDVLLTSEIYLWPVRDFSLSYLVGYNVLQFADIGAGIMFDRLLSVNEAITTPSPTAQNGRHFSFAGTKVMFRAAFDFKRLMPSSIWGANDMRLYGEAVLNGLKNYPDTASLDPFHPGYDKLEKRIPAMVGFNFPTFKALDVLSIEAEWWDNDFANSYWGVYPIGGGYGTFPVPDRYGSGGQANHLQPYGGKWHWSVYAKKTILQNLKLTLQFARDHTIITTSETANTNGDPEEAMDGKGNWAWMSKVEYSF
jgi:hypothetical protein